MTDYLISINILLSVAAVYGIWLLWGLLKHVALKVEEHDAAIRKLKVRIL